METDIRERIQRFLTLEGISPTRFADEIGVQRSGVSHILSGRNNPGFEFVQKILSRYKQINAEWLMMGTGNMLKTVRQGNLFGENEIIAPQLPSESQIAQPESVKALEKEPQLNINQDVIDSFPQGKNGAQVAKIVLFYSDNTFETFIPHTKP
jgi:transcriptional regulator with XRE-family HTH domain